MKFKDLAAIETVTMTMDRDVSVLEAKFDYSRNGQLRVERNWGPNTGATVLGSLRARESRWTVMQEALLLLDCSSSARLSFRGDRLWLTSEVAPHHPQGPTIFSEDTVRVEGMDIRTLTEGLGLRISESTVRIEE